MQAYKSLTSQNINFQVAQCTTPANYFHLLRRQMHRNYRKALVLAAPKVGLKHPAAFSTIEEMATGTSFQPIYVNKFGANDQSNEVVLCSGKVYYDLIAKI